ncbi:MAG: NAD(P)-binding domain-containing protein [Chloroflexota bacterium]|nr:NAD(P)-binding domain-containing protein [Chloroflexota bacterium]
MRAVDVVVIGAGQAGLATSYYLTQRQIDHVVLDRAGVGAAWRDSRWDSFALNGPNWSFDLPGYKYDGPDQDAFMLRDELVAEFEKYAHLIEAPVEAPVEVVRVSKAMAATTFHLDTTTGAIEAKAVVAATGPYQRRNRPANTLAPSIVQLNSDEFKNASQLPPGGVLVIGSGQSGNQIAEDLLENGRETYFATGTCTWIPRRLRGHDNVYWRGRLGMWDDTVDTLGHALRLACPPIQTGVGGGRDQNMAITQQRGAILTGRYLAGDGHTVHFADDLQQNAIASDTSAFALRASVDKFVDDNRLDATEAPEEPPIRPVGDLGPAPTQLDLKARNINSVIWATGFRLDFERWIDLPLNTRDGYPEQSWGVSQHPGLYFMGLQLMHTRKSGVIFGVGEDAAHVVSKVALHLGADQG